MPPAILAVTPGRIVLYFAKVKDPKAWPAIVVEAREDVQNKRIVCDVQPFATRGHGPQALLQDVPFSEVPGLPGTCCYPPRV